MRIPRLALGGLVGAGVAVVALAVGGAVPADNSAVAGSNTQTARTALTGQNLTPSSSRLAGDGRRDIHGMLGMPGGHGKHGRMLHGEFVVPKAGGGYETVLIQRGSVQAVSSTEITVRSADGFRDSYVIDKETLVNAGREGLAAIGNGEQVSVVATESGQTATAVHVSDLSFLKSLREKVDPSR